MINRISDKLVQIISYLILGLFSLLCLYPLLLTLGVSFSDENTVLIKGFKLIPERFSTEAYIYIWKNSGSKIINSYGITFFVTIAGTITALFLTAMLAYTMSQPHVKYRNAISSFAYFTVIFSAGIVPWYVVCVNIYHLKNTIFALILPYLVNIFYLFLLKNFFQSIPVALIESVKIDGANDFTAFFRIVLPLSKTAMLTVGFFYALTFWNDWWLPIMLTSKDSLYTLQYYLFSMLTNVQALANSNNSSNIKLPSETVKMAITVITVGPIIFLYPLVQKYFVKGIIIGGVKM